MGRSTKKPRCVGDAEKKMVNMTSSAGCEKYETEYHKNFCEYLKWKRAKMGFTQTRMAKEVFHVNQASYNQLENGRRVPGLKKLDEVARLLHVTVQELITGPPLDKWRSRQ